MNRMKQVLSEIEMEFGLEKCVVCCNPKHVKDALGFPWCEEHEHRGQILSWGYQHGYPALPIEGLPMAHYVNGSLERYYAIAEGEYYWWLAAAYHPVSHLSDVSWTLAFYIEMLDSLQQEQA